MKSILLPVMCVFLISACSQTTSSYIPPENLTTPVFKTFQSIEPTSLLASLDTKQVDSDPLLPEVRQLVQRHQRNLASGSGWWHRTTLHTNNNKSNLFATNSMSSTFRDEEWLTLDSNGQAKEGFLRIEDDAGQTLQVSFLSNGTWHNLTDQAERSFDPIADFDLGSGFYIKAEQLIQIGSHLNKQTLYQNCWYIGEKYLILEDQVLHEAVFNPDNGNLRWLKAWDFSTGSITLLNSVEVLSEEWVSQPPADVLSLFAQSTAQ